MSETKYDWAKLPEGVTHRDSIVTDGRYTYYIRKGALLLAELSPDDPDAAAEAYAKLRAAVKACEVDWRTEWSEAIACAKPHHTSGHVSHPVGVLKIFGGPDRRYGVQSPELIITKDVVRAGQIVAALEAAGWRAE